MIEGAIFDLDGTLLDSMRVWDHLAENCLRARGIEPKPDLMQSVAAMNIAQAIDFVRRDYGLQESCEELAQGALDILRDFYRQEAEPKPGVPEFLRALHEKGVKLAVATASDRTGAEIALGRAGILDLFACVVSCDEVGAGKSKPDVYREALKRLGTKKENSPVFEDTLRAAETACRDGFPLVAVYDASEKRQAELMKIACAVIDDFQNAEDFWRLTL